MNNKGFTMIELVISFSLTSIIVIILLQLVFNLKEMNEYADVRTQLLTKQANISNQINKELYQKGLKSIEPCNDIPNYCLNFIYNDNTATKLVVDKTNNAITIGDNKIELVEGSKITSVSAQTTNMSNADITKNNSILTVNVAVEHKYFEDDFGLYIVYQYNANDVPIYDVNLG